MKVTTLYMIFLQKSYKKRAEIDIVHRNSYGCPDYGGSIESEDAPLVWL